MSDSRIEMLSRALEQKSDTIIITSEDNISSIFKEIKDKMKGAIQGSFDNTKGSGVAKSICIDGKNIHFIKEKDFPVFINNYCNHKKLQNETIGK